MTEAIDSALILKAEEFAVILGMRKEKRFIGYPLQQESQSIEDRYKGLNSLIRRDILFRREDRYYINDAYRKIIEALVNMKNCFVISNDQGIIYTSGTMCLVRLAQAVSPVYSIMLVTVASLVSSFRDEGLIPDKDEYDFMTQSVGDLELLDLHQDQENCILRISQYACDRYVEIRRVGLCVLIISVNNDKSKYERYSVEGFTRELEDLLKGE